MPEIIILAGPNGAGKTTFANEYLLSDRTHMFVNADEIARDIADPFSSRGITDLRAAREMLKRIDALVDAGVDFMFETTLASLTYAPKIKEWQNRGFYVGLIYLRLPDVEASLERVRRRVAAGGHGIAEEIVRERFPKSLEYLEKLYKPIVDEWYIWDSMEGEFHLVQSWED